MKKFFKAFLYVLAFLVVGIAGMVGYLKFGLPDVGLAPDLSIDYTQERIERGRYLAHSVTVCMDCHSTRDWTKFSGPLTPGTLGKGGEKFDPSMGLPGVFYSKNITPAGIGRYTDGELFRVITTGVNKDGHAMFPLMPYTYYGKMDPEDIYSIIAYIRTLDPIENEVPASQPEFPVSLLVNTMPQPAQHQKRPEKSDLLAYGAYMTNASGCMECHTQVDKGAIIPERAFAGGRDFMFPNGNVIRSSNLTPDETGIGSWTKEMFLARFKMYADSAAAAQSVKEAEFNSIMPWTMYARMDTTDLEAIYAWLRTLKPVANKVEKFTPGTGM
ncbi:MAG: c-type cytochrome [Bacteroidota bacterium]